MPSSVARFGILDLLFLSSFRDYLLIDCVYVEKFQSRRHEMNLFSCEIVIVRFYHRKAIGGFLIKGWALNIFLKLKNLIFLKCLL